MLINFCALHFRKHPATTRSLARNRAGRRDTTESGRAFYACLAAVRAGIPVEQVPQWAAEKAVRQNDERYEVSDRYWSRTRAEGAQLDRITLAPWLLF
jgi:hypothetical protein